MSELSFEGRVAIVTGAGNGLGREHALLLAARGAQVVVNDLGGSVTGDGTDVTAAEAVAAEIENAGGIAVADGSSVASREGGAALVQRALDAFGRVDIVVNNAGILRDKSFHNLAPEEIDAVLAVHLYGAFWVTQPAFVHMREQGYGRIVNTSSSSGLFGNFGQANYGAAKMGVVGLTRVLALEGARHNIRVNAVSPMARTRMTEDLLGPAAERLDPRLVAPVVAFLSHESCDLTGRILSAGGGRVAEIFVGVTRGWYSSEPTIESIRDHLDTVCDRAGYVTPSEGSDEIALMLDVTG